MIRIFVNRPVFSSSVLFLILLGGFLGIRSLPLNQYPEITPPLVSVSASLPGASAEVAKQSVATMLEQQLNGTPRMQYMESASTNTGGVSVRITFEADADADIAAVDVQNQVKLAEARLPLEVVENGISVEKQASFLLMFLAVHSNRPEYDYAYLSNFATININDFLKRIPGVGNVSNLASRYYAMRVWLDPARMAGLGVTVDDVRNAIKEQNTDAAAGMLGTQPNEGVSLFFPLAASGRLTTEKQFGEVIIRANPDGSMIRLRDIAEVKLGSSDYNKTSLFDGQEATILGVYLLPKANPVATAREIRRVLAENAEEFPDGIEYTILYDYGQTIQNWLYMVAKYIVIAIFAALIVIGLVLRNLRSLLVIACILPVIFIGSFGLFGILGLTINMLSLLAVLFSVAFALDDMILIIGSTRMLMASDKLGPREAALKAAQKQAPTILVTALLLVFVFGVIGFMGGIPGKLYREFSYTLAICVFVSALLSITIGAAFCGAFLRSQDAGEATFNFLTKRLSTLVGIFFKAPLKALIALVILTGGAYVLSKGLPRSFLPDEDQGYILVEVILPDGATFERTSKVMDNVQDYFLAHPAVQHVVSVKGISARIGVIDSRGHLLIMLKPWAERNVPHLSAEAIMQTARSEFASLPEGLVFLFNPSTIPGLGSGSGFVLMVQDRTGRNWEGLVELTQQLLQRCNQSPVIGEASTNMQPSIPQFMFIVNEKKAKVLGLSLKDIYSTCATLLSSANVNDFNLQNRIYRVKLQAAQQFRKFPRDLNQFYVRNKSGQMVPIASVVEMKLVSGPGAKRRYNMFDSVTILGLPAAGYSSGQAIAEVEKILKEILPSGFGYQWSGVTLEEIQAAKQTGPMLLLSLFIIVTLLAARYENWFLPLAVILIVPAALCGALLTIWIAGIANGMYLQISMLALVGLAIKQASVTVAELKSACAAGLSHKETVDSTIHKRLASVFLVTIAFLPGLLPFILAKGAGAATRRIFTTGVFGGLIITAVFGLVFVPCFAYWLLEIQSKIFHKTSQQKPQDEDITE